MLESLFEKPAKGSTDDNDLECGDLSPLSSLGRLVGQAEPRPAARSNFTRTSARRRQVACRKRRELAALHIVVATPAALGLSVCIRGYDFLRPIPTAELRFNRGGSASSSLSNSNTVRSLPRFLPRAQARSTSFLKRLVRLKVLTDQGRRIVLAWCRNGEPLCRICWRAGCSP